VKVHLADPGELQSLVCEMAHASQPNTVKCASATLLACVPVEVEVKTAAVGLANDFNWKVRLAVA